MFSNNTKCSTSEDDDASIISQYAQDLLDYSSCYGSHGSLSYSAVNICGRPCKYPSYGDFAECFSLRHYGPRTDNEYSVKDIHDKITFHDFVVIQFENFVVPREITIFETYNPGAVVKILAYMWNDKRWEVLYEEQPMLVEKKSRAFCPKLKKVNAMTRVLRIEFDCSLLDYYIGIDSVLLTGLKPSTLIPQPVTESKFIMGLIQQKLDNVNFRPQLTASDAIEEFLKNDLNKFIENVGFTDSAVQIRREKAISDMPDEVIFKIMSFLDLKSLYNCSRVSKKFHQIAKDPLLYTEVNLRVYWYRVNTILFSSLQERCKLIRKLDLSSCGYYGSVTAEDFIKFLRANGRSLTHLRLNSSQFLNSFCLQQIGFKCENLIELSLQNYANISEEREFRPLSLLTRLETVDLSRSGIDTFALVTLMKSNKNLLHMYLAFNQQLSVDQICLHISIDLPRLRTLDLWKCHGLTTAGLRVLARCENLEVCDFGWNLREESIITDPFKNLIQNNPRIRKFVLAAVRGIAERDLLNIAALCTNLEYLDLMGIVGITSEAVHKILQSCNRLKVIDLSFCENLDDVTLFQWANEFNVCIKRSEVPSEF
ncbi:hypothetical protein PVAND_014388 [Polypedilum vanderplanki]|uniref:F-box domain-containing protein n=1 Tax=Polypedilum vanderplanki TaxID=319348 RepID=A0A9J6B9G2_POLVA|nr:hypothetical protein PVAND_014388 [Polypedilum vanderplanki]